MHPIADEEHDYKDRYVAFLDLLGFKALVAQAEEHPGQWTTVREVLALVKETLCEDPAIGMRFTYFSDCILISVDRSEQGLAEMFASINCLTFNLLQYDVLVRGGLVAGGAYHQRDFVYGTAVSRAYVLESTCAQSALTLLAPEVVEDAECYGPWYVSQLARDGPDRLFIDFLNRYVTYRPKPVFSGMLMMEKPAQRVRDFVIHRLNRDQGAILEKAEWLAAYWNRAVAPHGVFDAIEKGMVPLDQPSIPTTIHRRLMAPVRAPSQP
jgi:hypothetical protein